MSTLKQYNNLSMPVGAMVVNVNRTGEGASNLAVANDASYCSAIIFLSLIKNV
jgi:hypothetical protein